MKAVQKTLIFVLFVSTAVDGLSQAFVKRPVSTLKAQSFDYGAWLRKMAQNETGAPMPVDYQAYLKNREKALSGAPSAKTSSIAISSVGTSSNAYTILDNRAHQVFVDNPTKTLGWIHRQDINVFGTGGQAEVVANGLIRFDYSVDGGKNFPDGNNAGAGGINLGPLNPFPFPPGIVARPRYPQGVVYNPTGTTGRDKLKMPWISPSTDGNGWGNYVGGMTKNLTTIQANPPNQPSHPDASYSFVSHNHDLLTLIPGGMSMGRNGEFFVADVGYKPTGAEAGQNLKYLQIWKGTAYSNSDSIKWAQHIKFEPGTIMTNNAGSYQTGNANVSFSPDGKWGWFAATAHVNLPGAPSDQCESILLMYKSNDYGDSWKGPMYFIARDYDAIVDSIAFNSINDAGETIPSTKIPTALDFDITVDANGNPHIFTSFANKADTKPFCHLDSLGYLQTGRFALFDITTNNHGDTWCPKFVANTVAFQGTISGTQLSFNNYLQSSRSEDGTRIFFSWADDTSTTSASQMNPDVWDRALRITDDAMTPLRSVSLGDAVFGKAMFFPTISPVMYELGGGKYRMPTVFLKILGSETTPCEYYMINDRDFDDANFVLPTNDLAVTVLEPGQQLCNQSSATVKIHLKNVGTVAPASDTLSVAYMINGGTPVVEKITGVKTSLAPGAEMDYTFNTQASIPNSGTYIFDVMSMLPFDQHCENSNIRFSVANFGGAQKNLIPETQLAGCGAVTVTTGLPGIPTTWSKGGIEIAEFNGMETVTVDESILGAATGDLVVSVTNPNCAGEVIKDTVTIVINPPPTTNVFPADTQICKSQAPLALKASPNDTYTYGWYKRNDNGTFPAQPSPTTNEISIPSTGYYRVKVKDATTGCEITREIYAIIWDIKLSAKLGMTDTFICASSKNGPTSINASNATTPDGYGVTYDWWLTGQGHNGDPNAAVHDYNYNNELVQTGTSPIFTPLFDVVPKSVKYRVVAKDPLGCVPEGVQGTVNVTVFDTVTVDPAGWKITIEDSLGNFTQDITNVDQATVCCEHFVKFENLGKPTVGRGNTPITGVRWRPSGPSAQQGLTVEGEIGKQIVSTQTPNIGTQEVRGADVIKAKLDCTHLGGLKVILQVNSGPCSKTFTKTIQVVKNASCTVGFEEKLKTFTELNVYPNPSGGAFNLNVKSREIGPLTVTVFDLTGKMVMVERQNNVRDYNTTLDLSDKPAGIYLLKVETAQGFYTERLIKE